MSNINSVKNRKFLWLYLMMSPNAIKSISAMSSLVISIILSLILGFLRQYQWYMCLEATGGGGRCITV